MKSSFALLTIVALFSFPFTLHAEEPAGDPYAAVEHITLENGLKVFLAPSSEATLTSIRLNVAVGTDAEEGATIGVSHLLEHVLFRDKELRDEMSYLQLIREAGGSANGSTGDRITSYFASIPSKKGLWLLQNMGKMLLEPAIGDNYVSKEKGTIELERGRPSPIVQALRFNPMDFLYPSYLKKVGFWESEFGLPRANPYTLTEEQLSTQNLTTAQVQQHYTDYYYPSNMTLFVAGKFNREDVLKEINSRWGSLKKREGKVLPPDSEASPRMASYRRFEISTTPTVTLGTKLWKASLEDEKIVTSYMEFLAHRLMKEIRNIKGQTYTAHEDSYIYKGYGYATIQFETSKESFDENLEIARHFLANEARSGGLTPEQVKEAIDLHLSRYHLMGKEADTMMALAGQYSSILDQYGKFESPYAVLEHVTPEAYNASLKKHFAANQSYEFIQQPPVFFHYDTILIYFFSVIFCFMGFRRLLTQKFEHDQVRWIRKLEYPPLKFLEGAVLFACWYAYLHAQYGVDTLFMKANLLQSHVLLSQYFYSIISVVCVLAISQSFYSFFPRKLMIHDQDLMVKSVTYFSFRIPLNQIASVTTPRTMGYPFPLKRWLGSVKYRYYFFTPLFWKKGVLVTLTNGKAYYFSVKDATKTQAELLKFVEQSASSEQKSQEESQKVAA